MESNLQEQLILTEARPDKASTESNPLKGAFMQIMAVVSLVICQVFAKLLFIRYPTMDEGQYLFMRSGLQILLQFIPMGTKSWLYLYGSLNRQNFKSLGLRVLLGFIALTTQFIAVKNLPLALVALLMNMMPLFAAVFGALFLGEVLKQYEKVCLFISFAGVTIMVFGEQPQSSSSESQTGYSALSLSALILNPITSALVSILLRTLRGINNQTQAFYHAAFMTFIMGLYTWFLSQGLSFISQFTLYDYILLLFGTIFAFLNQVLKQAAVQYDTASRVTIYNYLQSIIQLVFDLTLFDYKFAVAQVGGICIVFFTNIYLVSRSISSTSKND